jgi:hypothetical protein
VNDFHSLLPDSAERFSALRFSALRFSELRFSELRVSELRVSAARFSALLFSALRVAELFCSLEAVLALGFPDVAFKALRDSEALAAGERPAVTGAKWLCCMDCCRCAVCCWKDSGRDELCVPAKCCEPVLRIVEGAAARPLADKLARVGRVPHFSRSLREVGLLT